MKNVSKNWTTWKTKFKNLCYRTCYRTCYIIELKYKKYWRTIKPTWSWSTRKWCTNIEELQNKLKELKESKKDKRKGGEETETEIDRADVKNISKFSYLKKLVIPNVRASSIQNRKMWKGKTYFQKQSPEVFCKKGCS